MRLVAFAFCLLVASLGATGMVDPARLIAVVQRFRSREGLALIAAMRLAFGGALFLVAPEAAHPVAVRWLGLIAIASGLVTPLVGVERFGRLLDWWAARGSAALRAWSVVALALGLWLGYEVMPALGEG